MNDTKPFRIKTISEFHRLRGLAKPAHPLISVINIDDVAPVPSGSKSSLIMDLYSISLKRSVDVKYKYGQQDYDFDDGVMFFMSPNQVFGIEAGENYTKPSGWLLLIHPDFLWNTSLAAVIKSYGYFSYAVNEALHLSEKEESMLTDIIKNIEREYRSTIDNFSQSVMISQIELLFNYANRFYNRQFITRQKVNHDLLLKLESLLDEYFSSQNESQTGLPTVGYVAGKLNVSPNYLSDMLRTLTGRNTQQHIHEKLIEKAKEQLATTSLSVSEIAYRLGFEHSQSFNKLFKNKTNVSPLEFRNSFG
jgi:AraC family transcriptional activator of pobA